MRPLPQPMIERALPTDLVTVCCAPTGAPWDEKQPPSVKYSARASNSTTGPDVSVAVYAPHGETGHYGWQVCDPRDLDPALLRRLQRAHRAACAALTEL